MDKLILVIVISFLYDILSIWGWVEVVFLRLNWYWLVLLLFILIYFPPIGFGMTMFCKYVIWNKKRRTPKKKADTDPDHVTDVKTDTYQEELPEINTPSPLAN